MLCFAQTFGGLKFSNLGMYQYASVTNVCLHLQYVDGIISNTTKVPWMYIKDRQLKCHNPFTSQFMKHNIKVFNFTISSSLKP